MRVAYFCRTEIPSGTANSLHIMKFCAALTRQKVQVDLHVFQRRGVEISEDVFEFYQVSERFNIIWHDILPGIGKFEYLTAILRVGWAVRSIIQQKGYQIFYGRDLTSLFFAALFDKRPIFIESHAPLWLSKSEKIFFWICLRLQRVSRLVVISNALASVYLEKFPDLAGRILVLPDGADRVPSRSPKKTVARIQNRYGTELVVGYTGSLYRGKGLEIISQIAPALPEVAFHIVGGSATDCEYWRSRITENNVLFYGFRKQQEVSLMIDEMDVCLLPNQEYSVGYRAGLGQAANLSKFTSCVARDT